VPPGSAGIGVDDREAERANARIKDPATIDVARGGAG